MPIILAILHFAGAFVLMVLVNWAGMIPWRRSATAHWSERARLLWPVRYTAAFNVFLLPILLLLLHEVFLAQSFSMLWMNGLAGFFGALLGCYPLEHEMFPALDFRNWCHQVVVGWGVRFGIWIVFFAALILMPKHAGWTMLLVAGGYLTFHFLVQYGLFLKYLRLVKFLKTAGPRLQQIVDALTARMAVRVRATWQSGGILANAFALPTTRELIFSDPLLEICTDDEVAAICTHELAHLRESNTVLTGRLLGSLAFFPLIFINPSMAYLGMAGFIVPYAGMFLIARFSRKLAHRMEKRADAVAVQEQTNEGVYARALEKIYRANQIPAVHGGKNIIHPHLYDRMLAAGITPDYPRPVKPRKVTGVGWLVYVVLGVLIIATVSSFRAAGR